MRDFGQWFNETTEELSKKEDINNNTAPASSIPTNSIAEPVSEIERYLSDIDRFEDDGNICPTCNHAICIEDEDGFIKCDDDYDFVDSASPNTTVMDVLEFKPALSSAQEHLLKAILKASKREIEE